MRTSLKATSPFLLLTFLCSCLSALTARSQWTTDGSGNIYNNNTNFVGIGTGTIAAPQATLEVRALGLLPTTAGTSLEIARLTANTGNGSELRFTTNRFAAGNGWTTANTRIQAWTDVTPQGYIDFNPNGSLYAVAFGSGSNEYMRILQNGNIGFWTTNPTSSFEVHSNAPLGTSAGNTNEMARFISGTGDNSMLSILTTRFTAGNSWMSASTRIQAITDATNQGYIEFNPNGSTYGIAFGNGTTEFMRLVSSGNLLIGKTTQANSGYMLDVNGSSRFNQVTVNSTGADYVFDPGYHLASLNEVAVYVKQYHHLPGILPAAQMQQLGLDLGENQTKLLAKIEELTLYLIEKDKEIETLKEKTGQLEERNRRLENLEQRVQRLERSSR